MGVVTEIVPRQVNIADLQLRFPSITAQELISLVIHPAPLGETTQDQELESPQLETAEDYVLAFSQLPPACWEKIHANILPELERVYRWQGLVEGESAFPLYGFTEQQIGEDLKRHSLGVAVLGAYLGEHFNQRPRISGHGIEVDTRLVVLSGLIHDVGETLDGDIPVLDPKHQHKDAAAEGEVIQAFFSVPKYDLSEWGLSSDYLYNLWQAFEEPKKFTDPGIRLAGAFCQLADKLQGTVFYLEFEGSKLSRSLHNLRQVIDFDYIPTFDETSITNSYLRVASGLEQVRLALLAAGQVDPAPYNALVELVANLLPDPPKLWGLVANFEMPEQDRSA